MRQTELESLSPTERYLQFRGLVRSLHCGYAAISRLRLIPGKVPDGHYNGVFFTLKCITLVLKPPHGDRTAAILLKNDLLHESLQIW